jgi:outer membrane lipoprotein
MVDDGICAVAACFPAARWVYAGTRSILSRGNAMRAFRHSRPVLRVLLALLLPAALGACAPPPIYKATAGLTTATPRQVAATPENFHGAQVIWGGRVVNVRNFPHHTEIELLGYPLDSSQRPLVRQPANGRFIAVVPGYVEALDYPDGALVTLRGELEGTRAGEVGAAAYTFPLVRSDAIHRWTVEEMREGHPNISIGVGVGGWIH